MRTQDTASSHRRHRQATADTEKSEEKKNSFRIGAISLRRYKQKEHACHDADTRKKRFAGCRRNHLLFSFCITGASTWDFIG
jgi:hypothetical protein